MDMGIGPEGTGLEDGSGLSLVRALVVLELLPSVVGCSSNSCLTSSAILSPLDLRCSHLLYDEEGAFGKRIGLSGWRASYTVRGSLFYAGKQQAHVRNRRGEESRDPNSSRTDGDLTLHFYIA